MNIGYISSPIATVALSIESEQLEQKSPSMQGMVLSEHVEYYLYHQSKLEYFY